MTSKLITDRRGSIGYLVLNTPQRRNALSLDMWQAIPRYVAEFDQNDQIRCLVITGSGTEAFAAGADISEFEANRATEETAKVYDDATREAVAAIIGCSRPVVAAIRGICFGGGVALAAACDLRVAASDARFCIPAARLGVAYGVGGTARLSHMIGASLAAEMLITARVYSAHEALMRGLVHQVAPVADFDTVLEGYTSAIAANAPLSMTASKRAIQAVLTPHQHQIGEADAAATACARSEDYAEGRTAFMQKRKPVFHGR
jgi:enoyl-CoA hydratase/carnithine racemase